MTHFLSRDEFYRLLQRELPEGVYADGPPNAFYTTADMDSVADVAATGAGNLQTIYANYFPQTAVENILPWVFAVFGYYLDSSLSVPQLQARVLAQLQNPRGMTLSDVEAVIVGVIPSVDFRIIMWNQAAGANGGVWGIGVSQLGYDTYLGGSGMVNAVGPNLCDEDPVEFGISADEWAAMQRQAYTYEVLIYDHTLTTEERREIDLGLNAIEPARSQHVLTDGIVSPGNLLDEQGNDFISEGGDNFVTENF